MTFALIQQLAKPIFAQGYDPKAVGLVISAGVLVLSVYLFLSRSL